MHTSDTDQDFSLALAASVHDMKNSIGLLLDSIGTLAQDVNYTPKQQKQVATIQYEAARVNSELVRLLSLYRMDNALMQLHIDEYFVTDLVEEQLARNEDLFKHFDIDAKFTCDSELRWFFDYDLVSVVVNNILMNNAKYAKSAINIHVGIDDNQLRIQITDDGNGYPESMLVQDDLSQDMNDVRLGGTHLGLHFASRIAQMHDNKGVKGRILLENAAKEQGGVFTLILP